MKATARTAYICGTLWLGLLAHNVAAWFPIRGGGGGVVGGTLITTYTIQNSSGSAWTPNIPYIGGQGFRRGDIGAATNSVIIRDAVSHANLVYQLDEIATRRENGDNGSYRHVAFSFLFPVSSPQYTAGQIPAGGTYKIEFVTTGTPYPAQSTHQTLNKLCTGNAGGAFHDPKLILTDVRNQDESARSSGTLTFDVCTNIANTGRDAPRQVAQGPVRDAYIVSGAPVYSGGAKDPLLYIQAYLDLTTQSDGVTLGAVRHIFRVDNSWMNVKAGSAGNSGAPGPVGLGDGTTGPAGGGTAGSGHGDPQGISYRPTLYDGSTVLLDWSWWDASVDSSTNPILLSGDTNSGCNADLSSIGNWTIPASDGANAWYMGHVARYSTTGTPPAGMTSGNLYFTMPVGSAYSNPNIGPDHYPVVNFINVPYVCNAQLSSAIVPTTQGVGAQTFSFRIWHTKLMSWYTTDQTGLENWALPGSSTRATSPLLPALTTAEQSYWKQTGIIPPVRATTTPSDPTAYSNYLMNYYQPMGRCNVIGGSGVGGRPDLGLISEYMSQAFLVETAAAWQRARVFSLCGTNYPYYSLLNEATGRVPVLNNGPPAGNHGGSGASYATLGAPFQGGTAQVYYFGPNNGDTQGIALPLIGTPVNDGTYNYAGGSRNGGTVWGNDHMPGFTSGMYAVLGSRHLLDQSYFQANRSIYQETPAPGNVYGQDQVIAGVHYYGVGVFCCERRGGFWGWRDRGLAAALGGDANIERTYFNDTLEEEYWRSIAFEAASDPSGHYSASITAPASGVFENGVFIDYYGVSTTFQNYAMLRDPLAAMWLPRWVHTYDALAGDHVAGALSSYYAATYYYDAAIHDASQLANYDNAVGSGGWNGADASDEGNDHVPQVFTAGSGTVAFQSAGPYPTLTNGDTIKVISVTCTGPGPCFTALQTPPYPDELQPGTWYAITAVNNTSSTFQVVCPAGHAVTATCPTPGSPYTSFTSGGAAFAGLVDIKIRPQYGATQPTGYDSVDYAHDVQSIIAALRDLGYTSQINAAYTATNARGYYDACTVSVAMCTTENWDPNVLVP